MIRLVIIALVVFLWLGCSAAPEAGQNGTCSLDCSSPVIAPANLIIERLDPGVDHTLICPVLPEGASRALSRPLQVRYRAYTMAPNTGEGAEEEGGAEFNLQESEGEKIPHAFVGFEPWIVGEVDPESTNDQWKEKDANDQTIANPGKFLGVKTSGAEMCSDSCGVMTYEFVGLCIGGATHTIQAGILSGFVKAKEFLSFTLDGGGDDDDQE